MANNFYLRTLVLHGDVFQLEFCFQSAASENNLDWCLDIDMFAENSDSIGMMSVN
jgi:hypothetical protein